MFTFHFIFYPSFIAYAELLLDKAVSASLLTAGPGVPILFTLVSSTKYILMILGGISVIYIYKSKNVNEVRIAILLFCALFAGVIGTFVIFSPTDRLIGFYIPLISIFAALTLYKSNFSSHLKNCSKYLVILLAAIIITGGFFGSQVPAFFFKDSGKNDFYYYSNIIPSMEKYKIAGEWSGQHFNDKYGISIDFDTRTIPFFYGKIPLNKISISESLVYAMINPFISPRKAKLDDQQNLIYNDGEVNIYIRGGW